MSRIGKKPVELTAGAEAKAEGGYVTIKGPLGELRLRLPPGITVLTEGCRLRVECAQGTPNGPALHGVTRTLIASMVHGVTKGYEKTLRVVGVGYKVKVEAGSVVLQLGYSHPVTYPLPPGVKVALGKENTITVSGCDKKVVGQVAADIRGFYPPEPYKGKGIRYADEYVRRKAGKAVATTT